VVTINQTGTKAKSKIDFCNPMTY